MVRCRLCPLVTIAVLGIILLVGGIVLIAIGDNLIQSTVNKQCQLHDGTKIYDNWRNPPLPFKISFYFFEVVDEEFLNGTKTPMVKERGPFVYWETRTKVDVGTSENGTISYRELRSYEFDEAASVGPNTTNISTINIVYMTLMNFVQTETVAQDMKEFMEQMLHALAHPIMTRSVRELLWGYHDEVLNAMQQLDPKRVPSDIVSIFYASVGEAGLSTFLINNGIDVYQNESDRLKKAGNIEAYNGQPHLSYWTNKYANMINGTDSAIWHSGATKDDEVYIFSPDLCRSLRLYYKETRQNPFDIENIRFTLPYNVFEKNGANEGFCLNRTNPIDNSTRIECLPSGLMSLRSCLKPSGSDLMPIPLPIVASSPHFLGANDAVRESVDGLQPDEVKHVSFMDVEPITGTVMNGSRRMQININVVNSSVMDPIANVKPFVYPLLWLDEHAEIDQVNADKFRSSVITPMKILVIVKYVLLGLGIALIVFSGTAILLSCLQASFVLHHKSSEHRLLINK